MAKIKMQCLISISGDLCKNCALYRARHYYLCFRDNYRGHLRKPKNAIDPYAIITKEREEDFKNAY